MVTELAVTDGLPPPTDVPPGECTIISLGDGTIRVDRADPRLLISDVILDLAVSGESGNMSLDCTRVLLSGHGYVGAILHINAVNQHVVYRITDYLPRIRGYIGEWPD